MKCHQQVKLFAVGLQPTRVKGPQSTWGMERSEPVITYNTANMMDLAPLLFSYVPD